jgi:hypothetical protein
LYFEPVVAMRKLQCSSKYRRSGISEDHGFLERRSSELFNPRVYRLRSDMIRFIAMAIRCKSVLLIVALLAVPLALLARGIACDTAGMICCSFHGSSSRSQNQDVFCGRPTAEHVPVCGTRSGHRPLDYGFIAPIAPTAPEALVVLPVPSTTRQFVAFDSQSTLSGIRAAPFEPPRS